MFLFELAGDLIGSGILFFPDEFFYFFLFDRVFIVFLDRIGRRTGDLTGRNGCRWEPTTGITTIFFKTALCRTEAFTIPSATWITN